ncbi:hypothetical protein AMTR_s00010p00121370 [Amborella trichopoda]|uniref:Uncharacterized protein n=1 Tax=Amborella trichopoda TaxID=13333 RepID=W1NFZ7_AMBTC|nr:hypothetical protein AMTR_s00010p00121370 [Amborella trichopoda]
MARILKYYDLSIKKITSLGCCMTLNNRSGELLMTETSAIQPQSKQLKMLSESVKGQSKTSSYHPSKTEKRVRLPSNRQGTINAMPPADRKEGSIT